MAVRVGEPVVVADHPSLSGQVSYFCGFPPLLLSGGYRHHPWASAEGSGAKKAGMLSQADKARTGAGMDMAAAEAIPPGREDAFGRARRHSRRVRVLKLVLPVVAAFIAASFPVYSYLAAPAAVAVQSDGSVFVDGKLVMANPTLDGFTKKNMRYFMTAARAIQDIKKEGIVELEGIDAKLPISADNTASIDAAKGVYNRDKNTLSLTSDVTVKTDDGILAKLSAVEIDLGKGSLKTKKPVDISQEGSRITSDALAVADNGKILVFENRVRVYIDLNKMKAAKKKDGGVNAAQ